MLTEDTVVDRIEIDEQNNILVRRATVILRDGVRVPTPLQFHRTSYEPGADISREDVRVLAIAAVLWTKEVIEATTARRQAAIDKLIKELTP